MEEKRIRNIIFSDEFEEYYAGMDDRAEIKKAENIVKRYMED